MTRRFMFWIHKYTGLILGLLVALMGLTGSILVFYKEIDALLNKDMMRVDLQNHKGQELSSFQSQLNKLHNIIEEGEVPFRLYPPQSPHQSLSFLIVDPRPKAQGNSAEYHRVYFNPYSGEYLGRRLTSTQNGKILELPFVRLVYILHDSLFLGEAGEITIGILAFVMIGFCLTGIYLWWPRRWKTALSIAWKGNPTRLNYDLHRVSGLFTAPILFIVSLTGAYFIFHGSFMAAIKAVAPYEERPKLKIEHVEPDMKHMSLDVLLSRAQDVFPDAQLSYISFPNSPEKPMRFSFRQKGEVRRFFGSTTIYMNPYKGEVIHRIDALSSPLGNTLQRWMFPLHNGEAFGMPGRLIVMIVGLIPTLLFVTGFIVWRRKQAKLKKKHAKAQKSKKTLQKI